MRPIMDRIIIGKVEYQVVDGTCYHLETPGAVINILEDARKQNYRIRLHYGDTKTGRDWCEVHDVEGYVGRSCGQAKVPILLYNSASHSGGAILDHCIVRITETRKPNRVLYTHPNYHIDDPEWFRKHSDAIKAVLNISEEVDHIA